MNKLFIIIIFTLLLTSCTILGDYSNPLTYKKPSQPASAPIATPMPTPKVISINAVGDVMLSRHVEKKVAGDYDKPFSETAGQLKAADITFCNLETSISTRGERITGKGIWFRSKPESISGLINAGFDVISLANNHILDYGEAALTDTMDSLKSGGIKYLGAGTSIDSARQSVIIDVSGIKIAFIGYGDLYQYNYGFGKQSRTLQATNAQSGISPLKLENIKPDISNLRSKVDLIAVSLHWGVEDTHLVSPSRRKLAHSIIDSGADMILGHHPHQLQGVEVYNGKPIIYSMGNFIFDQAFSDNDDSAIFNLKFKDKALEALEITPIAIKDYSVATYAKGQDLERIAGYMKGLCNGLNTAAEIDGDRVILRVD